MLALSVVTGCGRIAFVANADGRTDQAGEAGSDGNADDSGVAGDGAVTGSEVCGTTTVLAPARTPVNPRS